MTILSSDVNVGDTCLATGRNNLRSDVINARCSTQTRYRAVPFAAFRRIYEGTAETHYTMITADYELGANYATPFNDWLDMYAQAHLPNGATLTNMTFYYNYIYQYSENQQMRVRLYAQDLGTSTRETLAEANISRGYVAYPADERGSVSVNISSHTVNNLTKQYFLHAYWLHASPNMRITNVKLTYQVDFRLP